MAINERLIHTAAEAAAAAGTGNQEEGLILHLDANDVDSYDGDGSIWYDITNHEYTPAINPAENFNTVLYSHNSGSAQSITGVGFQPDLVWIKDRNQTESHQLIDSVRGAGKVVESDDTNGEATRSDGLTSFDSDGFSLGVDTAGFVNYNGRGPYVAWCFKAGGAAVSNTDGDITSSVSANTDLGFSIATYTGTGTSGDTFGHGLGVKPDMAIFKETSANGNNWHVYVNGVTTDTKDLRLNSTNALTTVTAKRFVHADVDANVVALGNSGGTNANGSEYVAYCFASKRGVSKVGSYKGTGSSGNKVYTGFQPAFVMFKNTSATGNWIMHDNKRDTTNPRTPHLRANTTGAEDTGSSEEVDFNVDGFTLKGTGQNANYSGHNYIYLAFAAEKPDSLIDDTNLDLHLDAGDFPQKGETNYSNTPTTWEDKTSNNYDGTITGALFDSELGNWLHFDGSDDKVDCGASVIKQNDMSVEMWVNFDDLASTHGIFSNYSTTDGNKGFTIRLTTGGDVQLDGYGTGGIANRLYRLFNSNLSANTWYHIVVIVEAGTATCYVNGESIAQVNDSNYNKHNGTVQYTAATTTRLGLSYEGSQYLDGKLGQVRIYDDILTAAEVMQNYRFTKNDYPNGKHATLTSATWASEGSFSFQNNQYAEIPVGGFVGDNNQIRTITAWVKADTTTSRVFPYTISSTSSAQYYFTFGVYNDNSKVYCSCRNGSSSNQWQDQFSITPDTAWHHIAVTFDGTTRRLYFDGDLQTTTEDNRGTATSSDWITYGNVGSSPKAYIGRGRHVSPWYSDGKVSDVKFFDRALTDDEIEADFNKGQFGEN